MKFINTIFLIISLVFHEGYSQNNQLRIKPITYVDSTMNHEMTVKELLRKDRLNLLSCADFESRLKIVSHIMEFDRIGYDMAIKSNSDSITELQKKYIRICQPGNKITFGDIKVKIIDSDSIIEVTPLTIKLTGPEAFVSYYKNSLSVKQTSSDNGFITHYYLENTDSLFVKDKVNDKIYKVKSFDFHVNNHTFKSNSNRLTDEMIKEIRKIRAVKNKVQTVNFMEIRYEDENGDIYFSNNIKLEIEFIKGDKDPEGKKIKKS